MKEIKNYINGEWVVSDKKFEKLSPFDGKKIADVFEADQDLVQRAVESAKKSQPTWEALPLRERLAMIQELIQIIQKNQDAITEAEVLDTGRSYFQSKKIDAVGVAKIFQFYIQEILAYQNYSDSFITPNNQSALYYSLRRAKGVIATIAPWNMPSLLLAMKIAPALITGNTVIAKPSEETPSSATILAELIEKSPLPKGVFHLVHGKGTGSSGEFLCSHPKVDAIMFTGDTKTGEKIMQSAAKGLRGIALELGGKNPAVVFSDANLEAAIQGVLQSSFFNCGQICYSTERVYIQKEIFSAFLEKFLQAAQKIKIGEKNFEGFSIGPLISAEHRKKVQSYIELAKKEGGNLVCGGGIPQFGDERDNGYFIQPTIFTGLAQESRFLQEEIFGPICHLAPFDSEEEGIQLANDTPYGLASSIWSRDNARVLRVAKQIKAGQVWVNSWMIRDFRMPLAGLGLSGFGTQFGKNTLEFCTDPVTVTIAH